MVGKPDVIALMGPTASGKSALGLALAQALDGEIISVDSALVYRGFDVGSAKPSTQEQSLVRHHLMDIRDPSEPYSAADFIKDARPLIDNILSRGKRPILCGGTMLYFKALFNGLSPMPPSDPVVREEIEREASEKGWPYIHQQLATIDPESASRIHPNHSQRLGRALEVYRISGTAMSQWQTGGSGGVAADYTWHQLALWPTHRNVSHSLHYMSLFDKIFNERTFSSSIRQNCPSLCCIARCSAPLHERNHVICRFANCRVAASARSRNSAKLHSP